MKALEARARTLTLDDAGMEDLRTIAQRKEGKGEALHRMLQRAELTHDALATVLKVNRSTVTNWTNEARWPNDRDLRQALVALGISRQILVREWQETHKDDIELAKRLKADLDFVFDPIDRFVLIADSLEEEVFIRQGFKAKDDTRAADFFVSRADMYREVQRKRSVNTVRSVNAKQSSWASGANVYDAASTAVTATPSDAIAFTQATTAFGTPTPTVGTLPGESEELA